MGGWVGGWVGDASYQSSEGHSSKANISKKTIGDDSARGHGGEIPQGVETFEEEEVDGGKEEGEPGEMAVELFGWADGWVVEYTGR